MTNINLDTVMTWIPKHTNNETALILTTHTFYIKYELFFQPIMLTIILD